MANSIDPGTTATLGAGFGVLFSVADFASRIKAERLQYDNPKKIRTVFSLYSSSFQKNADTLIEGDLFSPGTYKIAAGKWLHNFIYYHGVRSAVITVCTVVIALLAAGIYNSTNK